MKYRKKPIVIDAFLWTGGPDQTEDPEWIIDAIKAKAVTFEDATIAGPGMWETVMRIDTLEGRMTARSGDYIIRGVKGEIYPCKPDIFDATYEKVAP